MSTEVKDELAVKPEEQPPPTGEANPADAAPAQPAPIPPGGPPTMPLAPGAPQGAPPAQMPMNPVGSAPGMPPVQQPPRPQPLGGAPPPPVVPPGVSMPPANNAGPPMMATEQPLMPPQQGPLGGGGVPPMGGPPAGGAQPYRQLKVEDALAYLDQVKMKFEKQPHIYNKVRAKSAAGLRLIRPAPRGDARASRAPNPPAHAAANTRIRPPPQFPPSVSSLFAACLLLASPLNSSSTS